ncbi:MAG: hypothetical protein ACYDEX_21675, partial [Mobilitalea sp.]
EKQQKEKVLRIKIKKKCKIRVARDKSNNRFNLINPLSWFLREDHAKTTPSLRSSSGPDLKVKPMLGRRAYARAKKKSLRALYEY